jgi:hypothetical protein
VSLGRRLLQQQFDRWHPTEQDKRETISSAYSSYNGSDPNPTGAGDAFTYDSAEASATSNYNGVYYNAYDGGCSSSNGSQKQGQQLSSAILCSTAVAFHCMQPTWQAQSDVLDMPCIIFYIVFYICLLLYYIIYYIIYMHIIILYYIIL